jgi:hypothetical protein
MPEIAERERSGKDTGKCLNEIQDLRRKDDVNTREISK